MAQGVGRQAFDAARSQKAEAVARALAEQETNRLRRGAYDGLTGAGLSGQSARTLTGVLDYVPVVGDVAGAEDTYQAARAGDWTGAGVAGAATLLGVLPGVGDFASKMVRSAADGGGAGTYYRGTRHDSPFNDVDYAMFSNSPDRLSPYGDVLWQTDASDAVDVSEIQKDIVRALRSRGVNRDYGVSAAALARDAAPPDIVTGAGLWDNPELVEIVYEEVLGPRGISAVRTPDGLIRFSDTAERIVRVE